jgi:hypothetical protein
MLRTFSICLVAGGSVMLSFAGMVSAESFTTRIETRPFYGAVVTLEEGVRVFRALPADRQVIIDPNGTPVTLGFNESHVYEHSSNYNYNYGADGGAGGGAIYSAPFIGNSRGFGRGRGGMGNHFGHHAGPHHGVGGFQVH